MSWCDPSVIHLTVAAAGTHLMSEDEARDACHELSQEHQGQKHGILQKKNKSEEVTQSHI